MREQWARGLALATGLLVLVLSAAFAVIVNRSDRRPVADAVPPPAAVAIRRDVYVGESSAEAEEVAKAAITRGYRGFKPSALVWGSVGEVVEKLKALASCGYTDVIARHLTDEQPKVLGSLERLAEVRDALKGV